MTTITIDVPDGVAAAAGQYVRAGFCRSESEVFSVALADFVRRHRLDLLDQFAREDIAWAKTHSATASE